jgi:hypothetical protein
VPIISRMRLALATILTLSVACHHGGAPGPRPAASPWLAAYPALRWVPADATYVITAHTVDDAVRVFHALHEVADIPLDTDVDKGEAEMRKEIGFSPLSSADLAGLGIDPHGGIAIFSQGLSPTFAVAVTDPAKVSATIARLHGGGGAIQTVPVDGVEVSNAIGDRDVHVQWAIVDGWLLVHVDLRAEHAPEMAWFRAARAAGGAFAAGGAIEAAAKAAARLPAPGPGTKGPPLIGVIPVPKLVARLQPFLPPACAGVASQVGDVYVAAAADDKDASGMLAVHVPGTAAADAVLASPAGWAAARKDAPIQVEWNADVDRLAGVARACGGGGGDLASVPVRAGGLFLQALDLSGPSGRGAGWAVMRDPSMFDKMLHQIPGIGLASHHRQVGTTDVVDVSMPMVPKFSYAVAASTIIVAAGAGVIDQVVGAGPPTRGAVLGHLEIHPYGLSPDVWDTALEGAGIARRTARQRTLRRLQRWDVGQIDVVAEPGAIVVTGHGHRH